MAKKNIFVYLRINNQDKHGDRQRRGAVPAGLSLDMESRKNSLDEALNHE